MLFLLLLPANTSLEYRVKPSSNMSLKQTHLEPTRVRILHVDPAEPPSVRYGAEPLATVPTLPDVARGRGGCAKHHQRKMLRRLMAIPRGWQWS